MKRISNTIFIFLVLTFFTESTIAQQAQKVTLPDHLQVVLTNYETHWENSDAKALALLFTENGFILRPGNSLIQGRDHIEKNYANSGGDLVLRAYDFQQENDLAFIIGGYTYGNRTEDVGKYTLVLKKIADKWLIHSDMDNGNN